ncbi:MAG: hypothetical protein MJ106_00525 [Lentisphaeria bacterium]|nr:hypothetical protein [Lentisphaeria bacterium]
MNSNLIYVVPELLELDVPGGVFAGESGRNNDLLPLNKKWEAYDDAEDEDIPEDADAEDIP